MRVHLLAIACLAAATLGATTGCSRETASKDNSTKRRDVDNSAVNKRDRDGALPTPDDQKSNDADIRRAADIRKRIVDAKLSSDAENVKVIVENGRVTLRGPVTTLSEKETIARIASEVAGPGNVDDRLEVETATGR